MYGYFRESKRHTNSTLVTGPGPLMPASNMSSGDMLPSGSSYALNWQEYGDPHGYPLIYFHSQAGSCLEAGLIHETALRGGFRLIAFDRPGLGRSAFRCVQQHSDLTPHVLKLLEYLRIPRAGLLAWAGGAPFALAMARQYPGLVSFVSLLSPTPRIRKSGRLSTKLATWLLHVLISARQRYRVGNPSCYLWRLRDGLCHADRRVIDTPWVRKLLLEAAQAATQRGSKGAAQDCAMSFAPWHFNVSGIAAPVHLWWGRADTLTTQAVVQDLHATIPGATLHTAARSGHLFFIEAAEDVFRSARRELQPVSPWIDAGVPARPQQAISY